MLTPKGKFPLPEAQRRVEPCITQDSELNTLPIELFRTVSVNSMATLVRRLTL